MFGKKDTPTSSFNIREEAISHRLWPTDSAGYGAKGLPIGRALPIPESPSELSNASLYLFWHFEKTNSDYYYEIENPALKEDFRKVSILMTMFGRGLRPGWSMHYNNSAQHCFDEIKQHLKNAR